MDKCPSCGGTVVATLLTSIECSTVGCCNGPAGDGWELTVWFGTAALRHPSGAVIHKDRAFFSRVVSPYLAWTAKQAAAFEDYLTKGCPVPESRPTPAETLEEAKRLALDAQP